MKRYLLALTLSICSGAPDPQSSWAEFQKAVAIRDREAVAGLTRFPFEHGSESIPKATFLRDYNRIFDTTARKCIATARPVGRDGGFEVFCGELIYVFEKDAKGYRFAAIGVND